MCGTVGSIIFIGVGACLIFLTSFGGYYLVPRLIEETLIKELLLTEGTDQFEYFQEVPMPLQYRVRFFNITNPEEVIAGDMPIVNEVGPYVYNVTVRKIIDEITENTVKYRKLEYFEFNPTASAPNTEEDVVTMANIPFLAVLQEAEQSFPYLMGALSLGLDGVFGEHNKPVSSFKIGDLLFNGISLCENPGLFGTIVCTAIKELAGSTPNLELQDDGSLLFSLFANKNGVPTLEHEVDRGFQDYKDLGKLVSFNGSSRLFFYEDRDWGPGTINADGYSVCNMINGTDDKLFAPFVDKYKPFYIYFTDACRTVDVQYEADTEYEGIPTLRFAAGSWLFDQSCFCQNTTKGITKEDGCLFPGVQEVYSCFGAHLVMSFPHFLHADPVYQNGVIGLSPNLDEHRTYVELEYYTATPLNGYKRIQFNMFIRPISGISSTQSLATTLMPVCWVEDGAEADDFVMNIINTLYKVLFILDIIIISTLVLSCVIFVLGIALLVRSKRLIKATEK